MSAIMRILYLCAILNLVWASASSPAIAAGKKKAPALKQDATSATLESVAVPGEINRETFIFRSDEKTNLGVRVARVLRRDELPGGPWASGDIGDYLLENDLIRVVVRGDKREGADGVPGAGGVADMVLRDQMWDTFGGIVQIVRIDGTLFEVAYERISIHQPAPVQGEAPPYLLAEGAPRGATGYRVRTIMYVEPGKPYLVMSTQCTNLTSKAAEIEMLDRICWGTIPPFLGAYGIPEYTRHVSYKTHYVCGILDDFCLGVVSGHPNPIRIIELFLNRNAQAYVSGKVPAGRTLQAVRTFILSAGDMAPVLSYLLPLKKLACGVLEGQVTEGEKGKPVDDVSVELRLFHKVDDENAAEKKEKKGKPSVLPLPFAITRPDAAGHYRIALPVGDYTLKTTGRGRLPMPFGGQTVFKIKEGEVARFDNVQGPPSTFEFVAMDADSERPIPAKVRFEPLPPTSRVYLGPDWRASGARNVAYLGPRPTQVALAGGHFKCVFSAGPEYDVTEKEVHLEYGTPRRVEAALKKVAPARGMVAVDLDVATDASPGSRVSAQDLVLAAAGEGIEWIFSGDLNRATDLNEAIVAQGLGDFMRASPGAHLSYQYPDLFGEFYVFPVPADTSTTTLAALANPGSTPEVFFGAVRKAFPGSLICVAQPAAVNASYLEFYRMDADTGKSPFGKEFSLDFDALIAVEGKAWRMNEAAWNVMERLTMAGYAKLPLASSRCNSLYYAEPGYPRLYVLTGEKGVNSISEKRLMNSIREGKYFLTNGPIIEQKFDDAETTRNMTALNGQFRHWLRVTAAPWVPVRSIHMNQSLMRNFRQAMVTPGKKIVRFPFDEKSARPYAWPLGQAPDFKDIFFSVWVDGFGFKAVVAPIESETYKVFAATPPILVDGNGDGKLDFGKKP